MLKKNRRKWDKRARNFLKVDVTGQIKFWDEWTNVYYIFEYILLSFIW